MAATVYEFPAITVWLDQLPPCQGGLAFGFVCEAPAVVDAPVLVTGQWGYFCGDCAALVCRSRAGTRLEQGVAPRVAGPQCGVCYEVGVESEECLRGSCGCPMDECGGRL